MFRLTVARGAAEIDQLCSVWDGLISAEQSLFQSYRWNSLAAHIFRSREAPYFVFVENDNGAAIVPATIDLATKTISLAGEKLFDYRDCLLRGERTLLESGWCHLSSLGLPIAITAVTRPDVPIWDSLKMKFFSRAPYLSCDETTPEQFVRSHPRAFSRFAKLERMGLRIHQYPGDNPVVREIYERRSQQSLPGELFRDPQRVEFMIAACRNEGAGCEVFTLEHGSTLAAALVTFRDGWFRRFYTTYYDRRWARYSPGVSLLFEISRRTLDRGLSFDLMTGEQPYKLRIARAARDLFTVNASAAELRQVFAAALPADSAA